MLPDEVALCQHVFDLLREERRMTEDDAASEPIAKLVLTAFYHGSRTRDDLLSRVRSALDDQSGN